MVEKERRSIRQSVQIFIAWLVRPRSAVIYPIPLLINLVFVIVISYIMALNSWHIQTIQDQSLATAKLDLSFQQHVLDEFKTVHNEVKNDLLNLNTNADRRLDTFQDEVTGIHTEIQQLKGVSASAASAAKSAASMAAAARQKLNQKVLTGSEVQQAQQGLNNQEQRVDKKQQQLQQQTREAKKQIRAEKQKKAGGFHFPGF